MINDYVDGRLERVELTAEELAAADAIVLLTDHDAFELEVVRAHARYVLDNPPSAGSRRARGVPLDLLRSAG